jgi:hypothetical protein
MEWSGVVEWSGVMEWSESCNNNFEFRGKIWNFKYTDP